MKLISILTFLLCTLSAIASHHDGLWQGEIIYKEKAYPVTIEIKESEIPAHRNPSTYSFYRINNRLNLASERRGQLKIEIPHNIGVLPHSSNTHQLHTYVLYGKLAQDGLSISGSLIASGWTSERREGNFKLRKKNPTKAIAKKGRLLFQFDGSNVQWANSMAMVQFEGGSIHAIHQEINRGFRTGIPLTGEMSAKDLQLAGKLAFYQSGLYSGSIILDGEDQDDQVTGYIQDPHSKREIGEFSIHWH